jgi:hypothetical protein
MTCEEGTKRDNMVICRYVEAVGWTGRKTGNGKLSVVCVSNINFWALQKQGKWVTKLLNKEHLGVNGNAAYMLTVHCADGLVLHWMKPDCRPHATAVFWQKESACDVHRTAGWVGPKLWSKQKSLSDQGNELRSLSPAGPSPDPELVTQKNTNLG